MLNLQHFSEQVELERTLLAEGTPYVGSKPRSMFWTFQNGGWSITSSHQVNLGGDPEWSADRLRHRLLPLFFLAGWKILAALGELAIARNGQKVLHKAHGNSKILQNEALPLTPLPNDIWRCVIYLFERTRSLRNALIHRTARVTKGALHEEPRPSSEEEPSSSSEEEPSSSKDVELKELTYQQQKHFCELAQLLADAVANQALSQREEQELRYLLWALQPVHNQKNLTPTGRSQIVRVVYHIGADGVLPVADILSHIRGGMMDQSCIINLELVHGTTVYKGNLDSAHTSTLEFDPEDPPTWLQRMLLPFVNG